MQKSACSKSWSCVSKVLAANFICRDLLCRLFLFLISLCIKFAIIGFEECQGKKRNG